MIVHLLPARAAAVTPYRHFGGALRWQDELVIERLPEFCLVLGAVTIVGNYLLDNVAFGLFVGSLWLVLAYVLYRRRSRAEHV